MMYINFNGVDFLFGPLGCVWLERI